MMKKCTKHRARRKRLQGEMSPAEKGTTGPLTTRGLVFRGKITKRPKRMVDKIIYSATIEADRELGRIEGYFEFSIWGIHRHFDSRKEAVDFLLSAFTEIENGGFELVFEADRYHADESCFHLFVEGVNDYESDELKARLKEKRNESW